MQQETASFLGHELLFLVLGWLLGLLAPVIASLILNARKAETVKVGIKTELRELKHRLVLSTYAFNLDYGQFDKNFLLWAKGHFLSYDGINKKPSFEESIDMFLQLSELALQQFVVSQRDQSKGKSVKYARAPFLESQLSEFHYFNSKEQSILLEVLEHVKIHNETVDEAKNYLSMTFDGTLSVENRRIVNASLNNAYIQLAERGRIIADRIGAFSA